MTGILVTAAAYLIGAIPTGLIVGKVGYGVDIRTLGSGNIGSTNAGRVLGRGAGYLVLALDMLKGFLATTGAAWAATGRFNVFPVSDPRVSWLVVAAAAAAIIGNVFPVYIRFKGGKGVGVGAGVLLAMVPEITAVLFLIWLAARAVTRYVSVASILIAVLFPLFMWRLHPENQAYIGFALFAAALVIYTHRANIKRLPAGREPRIGEEKRGARG